MSALAMTLLDDRTTYAPGEELIGSVGWDMDDAPRSAELRLYWHTEGRGDRDSAVVQTVRFDAPQAQDQRDFRLTLPPGPYSFSGKLVSLLWALELIVGRETRQVELVLSPLGREVNLLSRPGGDT
jgi:hypothetical protein